MSSDKGDDDSDSTGIGGARPPRRPASVEDSPPPDDHTHIGAPPRPPPKVEKPVPPEAEEVQDTGVRAAPPPKTPIVGSQEPSERPEKTTAPPPEEAAEEEAGTAIFERPKVSLTRLAPPEHFGVIPLKEGTYKIGRSSSSDIPLYSPPSSRDHARLRREPQGWVIDPQPGRTVLVNGASTSQPTALGRRARIRLGEDELLFVDDSPAAPAVTTGAPSQAQPRRRRLGLVIAIAAAVLVAAIAVAWLSR